MNASCIIKKQQQIAFDFFLTNHWSICFDARLKRSHVVSSLISCGISKLPLCFRLPKWNYRNSPYFLFKLSYIIAALQTFLYHSTKVYIKQYPDGSLQPIQLMEIRWKNICTVIPHFSESRVCFCRGFLHMLQAIQYFTDTCWRLFPHRNFAARWIGSNSFWRVCSLPNLW